MEIIPETDTIFIGDQVTLKISVESNSKREFFVFPEFEKNLENGIEVLETRAVDTVKSGNDSIVKLERRYLFTAFSEGNLSFSKMPVVRLSISGVIDTLYSSQTLSLYIKEIPLDKDFQPFDIRNIKTYPSKFWLYASIIAVLAVLLAVAIFFAARKYFKRKEIIPLKKINPYEWAVNELEKLKTSNISINRTKEYYSQLTDIVREYIELQTDISIMEKTSDEILATLPSTVFSAPELVKNIADLFGIADLVKFAKYPASTAECEENWQNAYFFVVQGNNIVNEIKQSENEESVSGHSQT
ncbi:MAG: hypothetical protein LBG92_01875 [Prevotellaceae bacterium]|jgi:hypothetical protein|nr:hypothetical protein [Prevotellaceae bacterium]